MENIFYPQITQIISFFIYGNLYNLL